MRSKQSESLQEKLVRRNAYLLRKYHQGPPIIKEDDEQPSSSRRTESPASSTPQQVEEQNRCFVRPRQVPVPFKSPSLEEKVTNYLNRLVDPSIPYGRLPDHQQHPALNQQQKELIRQQLQLQKFLQQVENLDDNMET